MIFIKPENFGGSHQRVMDFGNHFTYELCIGSGPGETVETFFHERMASCFGHQPLTIARGRGGKYPSQREQWQLHGEVGDR